MSAALLAMLAPKKPSASFGKPSIESESSDEAPESKPSGGAKKLFMLAIQAMKDGDDDAAADAFEGAVRACSSAEESGEY